MIIRGAGAVDQRDQQLEAIQPPTDEQQNSASEHLWAPVPYLDLPPAPSRALRRGNRLLPSPRYLCARLLWRVARWASERALALQI